MHDTRIATDDDELEAGLGQPPQQARRIAHRRLAFRNISTVLSAI